MFRLESFHMYGIIGSAIMTGMISIFLIKRLRVKTINKEEIVIKPKKFHKGYIYGGLLFGFGGPLQAHAPALCLPRSEAEQLLFL